MSLTNIKPAQVEAELATATGSRETMLSPSELEEIWLSHRSELLGYARKRYGAIDAEDLVADVFESTLRALRNGNGPSEDVRAYLFQVLRNRIIQERKTRASEALSLEPGDEAAVYPIEHLGLQKAISCVLGKMQPLDASVLQLRLFEGRSVPSIAEELSVRPETISSRLYQAKGRFRSLWLDASSKASDLEDACRANLALFGPVHAGIASNAKVEEFHTHMLNCTICNQQVLDLETFLDEY